jgi:hypothetical protein
VIPPDNRSVGSGNPPQDVNNLSDMEGLLAAVAAQFAGFPGNSSIPADNAANVTAVQTLLGNALQPGLTPSGDATGVTDTANISALLNLGISEVPLGAGSFTLNELTPPANTACGLRGAGAPFTTLTWNNSTAGLSFAGNTGSQRFSLRSLQLEQNGTGDLIAIGTSGGNRLPQFTCYDTWFTLGSGNTGGSWINSQGPASSNSIANSHFLRCSFNSNSTTRTVPGLNLTCQVAGGMSNCTWEKCDFNPSDNEQYVAYISASSGASDNAYHCNMAFRDCRFEHPLGGAVQSMSGRNLIIENAAIWDIAILGGLALANSIIYIGSNSGQYVSAACKIDGYMRYIGSAGNGPSAPGPWDIEVDANSVQTEIRSATGITTFHTTATPVYLNFHSCPTATVGNSQTPLATDSAAASISNPPARLMSPDAGVVALENSATAPSGSPSGGGVLYGASGMPDWLGTDGKLRNLAQPPGWLPEDSGWLEYNFDPAVLLGSATAPSSGVVQAIRIEVRAVRSVTNVILYQNAAGTGLTTGENYAGLYLSSGTEVGVTADQTTTWGSGFTTAKYQAMTLTGGPYTVQPGFVWVLFLSVESAGGTPTFGKAQNYNTAAANPGTNSAAACRWGVSAGGQTVLPSSSFTPSSYLSAAPVAYWAGLS